MLSNVKELLQKQMEAMKTILCKEKEKVKEAGHGIQKKWNRLWDAYIFWVKGSDTEETFTRIIRMAVSVGTFLLVVSLMGLAVNHVVTISNQIAEREKQTGAVASESVNYSLTEQYANLVKRVEELTKKQSVQEPNPQEVTTEGMLDPVELQQLVQDGKDGKNGLDGSEGKSGLDGIDGVDGVDGLDGIDGINGKDGKSAYAQAVDAGFTGSEEEFARIMSNVGGNLQNMEERLQHTEDNLMHTKEELILTKDFLDGTNHQLLDMMEQFRLHNAEMLQRIQDMQVNFQNGCNLIAVAITAKGVDTPVDSTPQTMAEHIDKLADQRYNQGLTDGMVSAMENVQVEYEYHYHTGDSDNGGDCYGEPAYHNHGSMCYGVCSNSRMVYYGEHKDGNEKWHWDYECKTCGYITQPWESYGEFYFEKHTSMNAGCGYNNGQFLGCKVICGYEDGQILSAKIIYEEQG